MTTRTAVIGVGSMGKAHLRSLASVPAHVRSGVIGSPIHHQRGTGPNLREGLAKPRWKPARSAIKVLHG